MLKKALCLGMAWAMSAAMLGCTSRTVFPTGTPAEPEGGYETVTPCTQLPFNSSILGTGTARTVLFSASEESGDYVRIGYENAAASKAKVYLIRTDQGEDDIIVTLDVSGDGGQAHRVYHSSSADEGTYYVMIEAPSDGGAIDGTLSVAQYLSYPD